MAYAICNLDRMSGTEDSSQLLSVRFYDDTDKEAAIENASIVKVGAFLDGQREVRKATAPAGTEKISELALIANSEIIYDESTYHGLEEYINVAGKNVRAYRLHNNDGFSATAEAFSGTPEKGKYVKVGATTKMVVADSAASGTIIGTIDDVFTLGADTYYYVQVAI